MTSRVTRRSALGIAAWGALGAGAACHRERARCETLAQCGAPAGPARGDIKIAFGSCNKVELPQPLWESILSLGSDMWIWLGDCVYADTEDIEKTRALYRAQASQPDYARLVRTTPVVGTWDDHDYGVNDGGREYPKRAESQQAFLDFIGEPLGTVRRRQAGVYASYTLGKAPQSVKVILLDGRYHRDPPGSDGDVLGAEQWVWLESELKSSTAAVHLIGSSTQVISEEHEFEKWADFPEARRRLLRLLDETKVPAAIILSGDRHIAEISRLERGPGAYPLWEITSSGLTHSWDKKRKDEPNRHRIGRLLVGLNFGLIEIDWAQGGTIQLSALDLSGHRRLTESVRLSSLISSR